MNNFGKIAVDLCDEPYETQIDAIQSALMDAYKAGKRDMKLVCEGICWTLAEECDGQIIKQGTAEECAHRIAGYNVK